MLVQVGGPNLAIELWRQLVVGIEYVVLKRGPLSMAASQVCAFVDTDTDKQPSPNSAEKPQQQPPARPDVQFHFQPLSALAGPGKGLDPFSAFTSSVCQLRPTSIGKIRLVDADAHSKVAIMPNYLDSSVDQRCVVEAMKYSRKVKRNYWIISDLSDYQI